MKKSLISLLLLFSLLLTSCSGLNLNLNKETGPEKYSKVYFDYFDTVCNIIGYEDNEEEFERVCGLLEEALIHYDSLYDNYNGLTEEPNIYYLNKHAMDEPVKVDEDLIDLLIEGKEIYSLTKGKTNIAMGAVLSIWHKHREAADADPTKATLPDYDELKEASLHCNIDDLIIDEENSTVFYNDPLLQCDLGAIAKGYTIEKLVSLLKAEGKTNYTINFGGNVRTLSAKPDGSLWSVAIQNPIESEENDYVKVLSIAEGALTTSGSYQRYYTVDGVRYHHIINPDTLYPENNFLSVSILNCDATIGDALSTALFNMTLEEGKELINSLDGTEALWVLNDESIVFTDGMEQYIKEE